MHQERHTSAELHQLSKALLRLHKSLLDGERAAYERIHGPIPSNGAFLQLVLGDPAFAWLPASAGFDLLGQSISDSAALLSRILLPRLLILLALLLIALALLGILVRIRHLSTSLV